MSAEPLSTRTVPEAPEKPRHPKFLSRPASEKKEDLGFERQRMVDWLAPGQLARTGIKAVLSGVFGAYADKREVMAALNPETDSHDYSARKEIWIDYVADLGDGFDATYTLASLLAKERLTVDGHDTRRGDVLVLGGDQVYPTASPEEYWNRFLMPYRAALPCVLEGEVPHLFAVPGNHDWYDGLSNFSRIFCQGGWIGGWKAQQRRSYFALRLPHDWWLWAIDIQLEGYIDAPQLEYFEAVAEQVRQRPESRVILCTAEPSWVYAVTKGPEAFRSLAFFEDRMMREKAKCEPRVMLTGDLHHYTRYESADCKTQRITAGGGGAYLYATHQMPEALELNEGKVQEGNEVKEKKVDYTLKATFPSRGRSLLKAFGCVALPIRSWRFGTFLAAMYTLFAWILESASLNRPRGSLVDAIKTVRFGGVLREVGDVLTRSPVSLVFTLAIVLGLVAFCAAPSKIWKPLIGGLHGLAHVTLAILLLWGFARFNADRLADWTQGWRTAAFVGEMLVVGGLLGGALMAFYLLLCSFLGKFHTNEVFSSQRLAGYKNFLRLHIDDAGKLTIYPVGIRSVGKSWRLQPQGALCDPWWTPAKPIDTELIEEPIEIS